MKMNDSEAERIIEGARIITNADDEPEIIADVKEEKKPEPLDDILNFREVTDDFDLTLNSNRRDPWSKR